MEQIILQSEQETSPKPKDMVKIEVNLNNNLLKNECIKDQMAVETSHYLSKNLETYPIKHSEVKMICKTISQRSIEQETKSLYKPFRAPNRALGNRRH